MVVSAAWIGLTTHASRTRVKFKAALSCFTPGRHTDTSWTLSAGPGWDWRLDEGITIHEKLPGMSAFICQSASRENGNLSGCEGLAHRGWPQDSMNKNKKRERQSCAEVSESSAGLFGKVKFTLRLSQGQGAHNTASSVGHRAWSS